MSKAASRPRAIGVSVAIVIVMVAVALAVDCVGYSPFAPAEPTDVPEYEIDQASPYWDEVAAETEADPRPASATACLALVNARAFEEAMPSCELAQAEDGGADVRIALETIFSAPARRRDQTAPPE